MWRATAGIERHLGGVGGEEVETYCNGNFLKYMKVILMKSPNNVGSEVPTGHLSSPSEAFSSRTGLYPIELLAKGITWKSPPNNPGYY